MNAWLPDVVIGLAAGAVLGGLFFGGLMLTLRRLPESPRPLALAGLSALGRLAALGGGLVIIAQGRALRIAAALAGLLAVRRLLVRRWAPDRAESEGSWT